MSRNINEGKSRSNEEQIKNAFDSMDIINKTPEYYEEFQKSYEERNNYKNSENKNSREEIGERVFNIKEGVSLPKISAISNIFPKESQKENKDRSNEGVEELSCFDSLLFSFIHFLNQQKCFSDLGKKSLIKQDNLNGTAKKNIEKSNEEEYESKDIYYNAINEIGKSIKLLIKIYNNLLKINKNKKLNEKEKIIMKISEQNNKNNQFDIEIEKLDINNKGLEHGKQNEEDSKGKYDLILSAQEKELKNALKKKEEKEKKNRCNIKRISTKLKEKLKEKEKSNKSNIIDIEQSEKAKIINKFKEKKIKYITNNQKLKELNNKKNDFEQKDENSNLLRNESYFLENESNQKNQIMTLSENTKKILDMNKEIQKTNNKLSNFATKTEINILNSKLDELLNIQRNIRKEMQESKSQK